MASKGGISQNLSYSRIHAHSRVNRNSHRSNAFCPHNKQTNNKDIIHRHHSWNIPPIPSQCRIITMECLVSPTPRPLWLLSNRWICREKEHSRHAYGASKHSYTIWSTDVILGKWMIGTASTSRTLALVSWMKDRTSVMTYLALRSQSRS